MDEDAERVRRVACAICEQALFEQWRVPPDTAEVERRCGAYAEQARVALFAADGNDTAMEEARRSRARWEALLLGRQAPEPA